MALSLILKVKPFLQPMKFPSGKSRMTGESHLRRLKTNASAVNSMFTEAEMQDFMDVLPSLQNDLATKGFYKDVPALMQHITKSIQHNVLSSKKQFVMILPMAYRLLEKPSQLSEENIRRSYIMAWCAQFVFSAFLMADDMMDGSQLRRGKPTWHSREEIGMAAANDALLLESCAYMLLDKHFKDKAYYKEVLQEFHEATFFTCIGQAMDLFTSKLSTSESVKRDFTAGFDMETYASLVRYKNCIPFCGPICVAMKMAGVTDNQIFQRVKAIYSKMGYLGQVLNDFNDCFGDSKVKECTDIQNGRCSWLIVMALKTANQDQKELLKTCYGSSDMDKVERVRQVYAELNLQEVYGRYEEALLEDIMADVRQITKAYPFIPADLFTNFFGYFHSFKRTAVNVSTN